jgi:aminoglycoside 6'-N-acetyltransferase I
MATSIEITENDFNEWLNMALDLWPDEDPVEMPNILRSLMRDDRRNKNYVCKTSANETAGFINLSIRNDYVEGSSKSPVVYIEGIYVKPAFRKLGIAKSMVKKAESWGQSMGCSEIGSDAYASNFASRDFHKGLGFTESEPIVVFVRAIGE